MGKNIKSNRVGKRKELGNENEGFWEAICNNEELYSIYTPKISLCAGSTLRPTSLDPIALPLSYQ